MAKLCQINRNKKRERMSASRAKRRQELKALVYDKDTPMEERFDAVMKLAKMPRNSSKTRIHNRCELTGRARAYYRKFKLSRIMLRKLASEGKIPGVTKASW